MLRLKQSNKTKAKTIVNMLRDEDIARVERQQAEERERRQADEAVERERQQVDDAAEHRRQLAR